MFVVGCCMGIGKASVFKYIPDYFPKDVGAVGGLVGLAGQPWADSFCRRCLGRSDGRPAFRRWPFVALLLLTGGCLAWLHITVLRLRAVPRDSLAAVPVASPLALDASPDNVGV